MSVKKFLGETVAPTLVKLAQERDSFTQEIAQLKHKLAEYERAERLEKIARKLDGKGPWVGTSIEDRLTYVKEASDKGANLDSLEAGAELLGSDGSFGSLSEKVASHANSLAELMSAIVEG